MDKDKKVKSRNSSLSNNFQSVYGKGMPVGRAAQSVIKTVIKMACSWESAELPSPGALINLLSDSTLHPHLIKLNKIEQAVLDDYREQWGLGEFQ